MGLKKINQLFLFITCLLLTSCWAPRCPIKSCDVAQEHRHAVPTGTYSGRPILSKWRFHNFFSKKDREKRQQMKQQNGNSAPRGRAPRKAKKLFDWERE